MKKGGMVGLFFLCRAWTFAGLEMFLVLYWIAKKGIDAATGGDNTN
jgi:hypothetical protein